MAASAIAERRTVLGGPPSPIRALAEAHFGRKSAAFYLAAMNRSSRFVVSLHGVSRMVLFQHRDDVMVQRLAREFGPPAVGHFEPLPSATSSRYRMSACSTHRAADVRT